MLHKDKKRASTNDVNPSIWGGVEVTAVTFILQPKSEKSRKENKKRIRIYFTLLCHGFGGSSAFREVIPAPSTIPSWLFPVKSVTPSGSRRSLTPPRTQLVNVPDFGTSPWVWAKSGVRGWNVRACAFLSSQNFSVLISSIKQNSVLTEMAKDLESFVFQNPSFLS